MTVKTINKIINALFFFMLGSFITILIISINSNFFNAYIGLTIGAVVVLIIIRTFIKKKIRRIKRN